MTNKIFTIFVVLIYCIRSQGLNVTLEALNGLLVGRRKLIIQVNDNNMFESGSQTGVFDKDTSLYFSYRNCPQNIPKAEGDFVSVQGSQFYYQGRPFYFLGMNGYHLVYLENYNSADVDRTFERAREHGIKVVRMWAFSNDISQDIRLDDANNNNNNNYYIALDSVVSKAHQHGIKIVLALVNYWDDFVGADDYVQAVYGSIEGKSVEDFYRNEEVKNLYKAHVCKVVSRYRDDPTIMGWNLINEPRCPGNPQLLADWVNEMASFIKSIDPNHLVTVGSEGFFGQFSANTEYNPSAWAQCTGTDYSLIHSSQYVDYSTVHVYPSHKQYDFEADSHCDAWCQFEWVKMYVWNHFNFAQNELNKPLVVEEFGVSVKETYNAYNGELIFYANQDRIEFFKIILGLLVDSQIRQNSGAGAVFWMGSIVGFPDHDGYTVYLDDEAVPDFEVGLPASVQDNDLFRSFIKEHVQLECTKNAFAEGNWIAKSFESSHDITFEQLYGNNEREVLRDVAWKLDSVYSSPVFYIDELAYSNAPHDTTANSYDVQKVSVPIQLQNEVQQATPAGGQNRIAGIVSNDELKFFSVNPSPPPPYIQIDTQVDHQDQDSFEDDALTECEFNENAQYEGSLILVLNEVESIEECCQACQRESGCNMFVYCPKIYDCLGKDSFYDYQTCSLLFSQPVSDGQPPMVLQESRGTHFSSGIVAIKGQ